MIEVQLGGIILGPLVGQAVVDTAEIGERSEADVIEITYGSPTITVTFG